MGGSGHQVRQTNGNAIHILLSLLEIEISQLHTVKYCSREGTPYDIIKIMDRDMDNSKTSADLVMFEYTGDGCYAPKDVTSVQFNEGLQNIGEEAFRNCTTSLKSITLPSTVTEIGKCAFYGCRNLREVTLNEGLEKIDDRAFIKCSSLESIISLGIGTLTFSKGTIRY